MTLRALIFDVDGTLADTEEAHREAFNDAFLAHGLPWQWSAAEYRQLLGVTGGKERIRRYVDSLELPEAESRRLHRIVPHVHRTKTESFAALVEMGGVPLLPGIARIIAEARGAGLRLAIASTTTPQNATALLTRNIGTAALAWFDTICTGDIVARKKPAPDIYLRALACMDLPAADCLAIEDSELGVRAAKAAGLVTVAIPTRWTRGQDFGAADLVVLSLGDAHPTAGKRFGLDDLRAAHAAREATPC